VVGGAGVHGVGGACGGCCVVAWGDVVTGVLREAGLCGAVIRQDCERRVCIRSLGHQGGHGERVGVPDGAIGSGVWPGLSKLVEECGEVLQVAGKVLAFPDGDHPDGESVSARLSKETADLAAAIEFLLEANPGLRVAGEPSGGEHWTGRTHSTSPRQPTPAERPTHCECWACGGAAL
jgi:hypothetical protein